MSKNQHSIKSNSQAPLVVKLGGSLMERIDRLIPVLARSPRPLFIVPGGGSFADSVRDRGLPDGVSAHWMAVAAMDQFGWFLASKGLATTDRLAVPEKTFVFLPYVSLRKHNPLPHTWDITSDTIAAWVAGFLNLELLVLKSVDGIIISNELQEVVNGDMVCDAVDPFFLNFVLKNKIRASIINGSVEDRVEKFLNGEYVPGTVINTTF